MTERRAGMAFGLLVGWGVLAACGDTGSPAVEETPSPVVVEDVLETHRGCFGSEPDLVEGEESWFYCQPTPEIELVKISETQADIVAVEEYGLIDGALVEASESTVLLIDGEPTAPWSVFYVIDDGRVSSHESFGHGATEVDSWRPEAILARWSDRVEGYEAIAFAS